MTDVVADLGHLFLGSRLKRLAERFQTGAGKAFRDAGHAVQPGQMPLLAALDRFGPLTVNAMVEALGVSQPAVTRNLAGLIRLGLVEAIVSPHDRRQKTIALTAAGVDFLGAVQGSVWPRIDAAVAAMCAPLAGPLLGQLAALEAALAEKPLEARVAALAPAGDIEIVAFSDDLAGDFERINAEWIEAMYTMEATDRDVLGNPRARIIDRGGDILFARLAGLGVVGACALMPSGDGAFELTKMGVSGVARGRKVGEALLAGVIARACQLAAAGTLTELYLLTNTKSAAAIHLYEKLGFVHSEAIMARFGRRYERCNVAMRFPL
jgi:DNA-binding MarR family transcriptional regulator/ribosomal protein S18 acetylase RimI-like enzyme